MEQVTTSGTMSDNKCYNNTQCVTTSNTKRDSEWEQVKKSGFRFQNKTKGQSDSWRFLS